MENGWRLLSLSTFVMGMPFLLWAFINLLKFSENGSEEMLLIITVQVAIGFILFMSSGICGFISTLPEK